jgi:hypothetical protein
MTIEEIIKAVYVRQVTPKQAIEEIKKIMHSN